VTRGRLIVLMALVIHDTGAMKRRAALEEIVTIERAARSYLADLDACPASVDALATRVNGGSAQLRLGRDPWGHAYVLECDIKVGMVKAKSYGADGTPGGAGENADIP